MFRLIKLLMMTVLGYVIYQMWQGMRDADGAGRQGGGARRDRFEGAGTENAMNLTGPARGTITTSEDERSGMSVPHVVGRGVIQ